MRRTEITPKVVDAAMAQLPFTYEQLNGVIHVGSTSQRDPLTGEFILKRPLNDIDLVMDLELQEELLETQPDLWQRERHSFTRADGTRFQLRSLRGMPDEEGIPVFDVWSQWFDPAGSQGNRHISPERLRKRSIRQRLGYWGLHIDAAVVLNERFGRPQNIEDGAVLRQYSQFM